MNYKKLFFGYLAFNFICGAILGLLNSKASKPKLRVRTKNGFQTEEMQEIYEHYINQARNKFGHEHKDDLDFPEWVNTDEQDRFNSIVGRLNHPTNRQK
jgi:hypothetical protein